MLSLWGVGSLLMAVIGFGLCLFSVRHDGGPASLARAGTLVAAVGAILSVLIIIGGLLNHV